MSASDLGLHNLLHNPRASGTRPQSFWERVGEQGLHTGLRELSSLPIKKNEIQKDGGCKRIADQFDRISRSIKTGKLPNSTILRSYFE